MILLTSIHHPFSFTCHNFDELFRVNWWTRSAQTKQQHRCQQKSGPRAALTRANVNYSLFGRNGNSQRGRKLRLMTNKINHRRWKWKFSTAACRTYEFSYLYFENYNSFDFTIRTYRSNGCCFVIVWMRVLELMLNCAQHFAVNNFNWGCDEIKLTSISICTCCRDCEWTNDGIFGAARNAGHKNANRYPLFSAFLGMSVLLSPRRISIIIISRKRITIWALTIMFHPPLNIRKAVRSICIAFECSMFETQIVEVASRVPSIYYFFESFYLSIQ